MKKSAEIVEVERELIRLGGTVDRSRPDHVQFRYPGLPVVGVHCNTKDAPKRLINMLRRIAAGRITPPRPAAALEPGPDGARVDRERPSPVRPNPPRPLVVAAPVSSDVLVSVVTALERCKAEDRAKASAQPSTRPGPVQYVQHEAPLIFHSGLRYECGSWHLSSLSQADQEQLVAAKAAAR